MSPNFIKPVKENDFDQIEMIERKYGIRSEVAQEIISRKPDLFERWTIPLFLLIFCGVLFATKFIKYPDIIYGSAILTSDNAPKELIPHQGGKLVKLFANNNQFVKSGQVLGWLESSASHAEVIDLEQTMNLADSLIRIKDFKSLPSLMSKSFIHLGEIQTSYQSFTGAWQQFNDYMVNGFYNKKRHLISEDIRSLNDIRKYSDTEKNIVKTDNELAAKTYSMNEKLYNQKVISLEEFRQAQSKLLVNQKNIPLADVNIITQNSQIRDKEREVLQLDHDINQSYSVFIQSLYTLKNIISDWLKNYTLQAPTDGSLVLVMPLQQNQFVQQGKILGFVNPEDSHYYMEIKLSQNNFGKVDTGMKVQIRFDAYPYEEFGFVLGKLNYLSKIAVDSGFLGTVKLEQGLITSSRKTIPFKNGLKAQALIITKDMRLSERLYLTITKSLTMNK